MCKLLEPAPGLVVDFHPTFAWLFAGAVLVVSVSILVGLGMAQPDHEPTMARSTAWGIALLATVLLYASASFFVFVVWPTSGAQRLWAVRKETVLLNPVCVAVINSAYDNAVKAGGVLFVACSLAPWVASTLLYRVAFHGRGLRYR
jgi:hypothetical protein